MTTSQIEQVGGKGYKWVDDRVPASTFLKRNLGKVFPDHWSFMLGEIALYSFIILLLSGTFLSLWFKPSMIEVVYDGSYIPLNGVKMSEAYASTLDISFDIRGGLLMRQIHHWGALFFVAAISVHLLRVFFTGAFRKPREINWVIGVGLLTLALLEGFAGYSLPDDLLSGTGLRIAEGITLAIPLVGTYLSFFIFGGQFPGSDFIPRLYTVHVLLVPGVILALITVHLMLVWYQKHTQFPGPGRTEKNVVGYPLFPVYTAKAGGFFFVVFGLTAAISAVFQINPIWVYGPYVPDQLTAGSQPDWYIGWLEGALRMMPNIEINFFSSYTLSVNVLVPAAILPGLIFTVMALYPWIEQWATGDKKVHHLLDRPRNAPTRTALGAMALSFYVMLWIEGGNDLIASTFSMNVYTITWFFRIAIFVVPPLVFVATRRICLALQRRDRDKLLHGYETGIVKRLPSGEYYEQHAPISDSERAVILDRNRMPEALPMPEKTDANGVKQPGYWHKSLQARLSRFFYGEQLPRPTPEEIEAAGHHETELTDERDHEISDSRAEALAPRE
ncbi:MAG TPA: ubiquinol-cytochrome c reductase cytochrome b subunit [Actinomycetes bacterium]|nr:ubiquinol-cytochrome c reductase cytochrome b subunit [Actinomycetes bacterium]